MIPLILVVTWIASAASGFPIGNTAHFGGLVAGLAYGAYLRTKYKRKTRMISKYFSR
jgi:membrane associated rhomboid family serine protease